MSEITTNEIVPAVKATQVHKAFGNLHVLKGIDMLSLIHISEPTRP